MRKCSRIMTSLYTSVPTGSKSLTLLAAAFLSVPVLASGVSYANAGRICKSPVVGIGYGSSKALARANAVQAWSRRAKRAYHRTFRIVDARVISDIRCQYVGGDRDYGRYAQRRQRRMLPGEVGNPSAKWSCTVNARPCYTRHRDSFMDMDFLPRWKVKMCKMYARRSVRQQRRNRRLGCEYSGRYWHANKRRHFRTCLSQSLFRTMRILHRRRHQLRRCD